MTSVTKSGGVETGSQELLDRKETGELKCPTVTTIQPLRFLLTIFGFAPARNVLTHLIRLVVFAAVIGEPILIFLLASKDSKFAFSTLAGVGIISLISWFSFPVFTLFMVRRRNHLDEIAATIYALNTTRQSDNLRAVRNQVAAHTFAMIAVCLFFSIWWICNTVLGFEDDATTLLIIHGIMTPFAVTAYLAPLMIYTLACNLHRLQAATYVKTLKETRGTQGIRDAMMAHSRVRQSISQSSRLFTGWLFPSVIIVSFSVLFQLYGYWRETASVSTYNGSYYLGVFFLLLVYILLVSSSVTAGAQAIREAISDMYIANYDSRDEMSHFLTYLHNAKTEMRIFGIAITPAMSSYVLYAVLALSGAYIHEALYGASD